MLKTALRYGLTASILLLGIIGLSWLIFGDDTDFTTQEILGYASMAAAQIFVFLGIRHYRDQDLNGQISFLEALKMGLLIAIIPSILFGAFDYLYTTVLNPDFAETYMNAILEQQKAQLSAEEFEKVASQMKAQMEQFGKPHHMALLMVVTVFAMGIIASVISALLLRRSKE